MISFLPSADDSYNLPTPSRQCHRDPSYTHNHFLTACPRPVELPLLSQSLSALPALDQDTITTTYSTADARNIKPIQLDLTETEFRPTRKPGSSPLHRGFPLTSTDPATPTSPSYGDPTAPLAPQIATPDSTDELDMYSDDTLQARFHTGKPLSKSPGTAASELSSTISRSDLAAFNGEVSGPCKKTRIEPEISVVDLADGTYSCRPVSVSSSLASDTPTAPGIGDSDPAARRTEGHRTVPKLSRTITDVYSDELYSPNFAITSTSSMLPRTSTSPTNDIFSQRINAANSQHLSAAHSPRTTNCRTRSPFRKGSPFVASSTAQAHHPALGSSHEIRKRTMLRPDDAIIRPQSACLETPGTEYGTPKTISPKHAVLEFNEVETEGNSPLSSEVSSTPVTNTSDDPYLGTKVGRGSDGPIAVILPSDQRSVGTNDMMNCALNSKVGSDNQSPPLLSTSGSSSPVSTNTPLSHHPKPLATCADGGTYTCTYHGCAQRFETPILLQKHKREGHRQVQGPAVPEIGASMVLLNSQAGPHRCDRINPSTGKSCDTIFSRPYDLTRHEDTIHNVRKQKVRCQRCTEEKTFSRADALTRHYRVCHPDVELFTKQKRRGVL